MTHEDKDAFLAALRARAGLPAEWLIPDESPIVNEADEPPGISILAEWADRVAMADAILGRESEPPLAHPGRPGTLASSVAIRGKGPARLESGRWGWARAAIDVWFTEPSIA